MIELAVIIILIILLLISPFATLIVALFGALFISVYSSRKIGGEFINPSFDNVFNIDKKIISVDKLRYSEKHYIIVNRPYMSAKYELVGHSINSFFGNSGQDHSVVVDMDMKIRTGYSPLYFVVNRPVIDKHLLEIIDSSYRNYIIPDDSIWYCHLNYYFLGQTADPQGLMSDIDGLLIKNFAFDFEYGFAEINPKGVNDYMIERRTFQLSKINASLLNASKNTFDHFNLLFISRLKDLIKLGSEGDTTFAYNLLKNAQKLIEAFQVHPYWMEFYKIESQISEKVDILKHYFPELSDVELKRFVRYYFLVDKNEEMLTKRLLIHILAKLTNMCNLFDTFMVSKFRVDIFPVFSRNDFYRTCERLISGITFDLSTISKEKIHLLIGETTKRLTMENIKNEILKGNYVDAKTVKNVNMNNTSDIKEYCLIWDKEAHDNIKQLCASPELSGFEREKNEEAKKSLIELNLRLEKIAKEHNESEERKYLRDLPNIIKKSDLEEIFQGAVISDFVGSSDEEIKEFLKSYLTDQTEIDDRLEYIRNRLKHLEHYKKELNELNAKYPDEN